MLYTRCIHILSFKMSPKYNGIKEDIKWASKLKTRAITHLSTQTVYLTYHENTSKHMINTQQRTINHSHYRHFSV
jgi:hypothetical protein